MLSVQPRFLAVSPSTQESMLPGLKRRSSLRFKSLLSKLLPDSTRLRYLAQLPLLEGWRRLKRPERNLFATRFELYDHLNATVLENSAIEFLEFGVYRGDSMRHWAHINTNPGSRFVGFDTFEGLPEVWRHFTETSPAGLYDTGGELPRVDDERIRFVKGLFQETLLAFLQSRGSGSSQLVIHLDADLYSSTLYVLARCDEILTPGAIVVFDEFSAVLHEFRALEDYCASHLRRYEVLAATRSPTSLFDQLAIRMS